MLVKDIHKGPGYTVCINGLEGFPNFLLGENMYQVGFANGRVFYVADPIGVSKGYLKGITFEKKKLTLAEVIADIERRNSKHNKPLGINVELVNDPMLVPDNVKLAEDKKSFEKVRSAMYETLYQIHDKLETAFESSSVKVDFLERFLFVKKQKDGTKTYRPGKGYAELKAYYDSGYLAYLESKSTSVTQTNNTTNLEKGYDEDEGYPAYKLKRIMQNTSTNAPELNPTYNTALERLERYFLVTQNENGTEEYGPGEGYEKPKADDKGYYVEYLASTNAPEHPTDNTTNIASNIYRLASAITATLTTLTSAMVRTSKDTPSNIIVSNSNTTDLANNTTDQASSNSLWMVPVVCGVVAGAATLMVAVGKRREIISSVSSFFRNRNNSNTRSHEMAQLNP